MRKLFIASFIILVFIIISGCTTEKYADKEIFEKISVEVSRMRISSPEFQNNEMIPSRFTCQGQDISPALEFSDVPKNVQSFVLVVDDPDAPMGTWVHWVLFNIPPDVREIAEDSAPENAVQGRNSWSKNSYGGPCPPLGTHRYFFKLYALNMTLDLDSTAVKGDVEEAMQEYVLDKAQLIGLYERE